MLTQAARRFSTRERAIRPASSSDSHVVRTTILSVIAELEYHRYDLFVAKGHHRVDSCRAPRRQITRHECDGAKDRGDGDVRHRVRRGNAKQEAFEKTGGRERSGEFDGNADPR